MAEMVMLKATKREVTGKGVRHLRSEGLIPGVLYGPEFDAVQVQVPWVDLRMALLQAGGSHIITLDVDGTQYNALVRNVQRAPLRGNVLHVDFYRVRMDVAIRNEVPIVLVGNASAIELLGGGLLQEMTSVEVECLPMDLPSEIQVDVSGLTEIGQRILANALPTLPGVTYHVDADSAIVSTVSLEQPEEAELEGASMAEPELIRRRPEEFEEE